MTFIHTVPSKLKIPKVILKNQYCDGKNGNIKDYLSL